MTKLTFGVKGHTFLGNISAKYLVSEFECSLETVQVSAAWCRSRISTCFFPSFYEILQADYANQGWPATESGRPSRHKRQGDIHPTPAGRLGVLQLLQEGPVYVWLFRGGFLVCWTVSKLAARITECERCLHWYGTCGLKKPLKETKNTPPHSRSLPVLLVSSFSDFLISCRYTFLSSICEGIFSIDT